MWCITLITLQILNHSCIPGINQIWSWCMILLMYCWIQFANILLRIFSFKFISDTGLQSSFCDIFVWFPYFFAKFMKRNVILTSQCFCCHFCCQWNITKIVKFWSFMEFKSPFREYSSAKGSGTHNQQLGSSVLPEAKCFCCFFVSQMFYIHEEKLANQNFCYWITTKTFYNSSLSFFPLCMCVYIYIYIYIYTLINSCNIYLL